VTNDDAVVGAPLTGASALARAGAIVVVGFVIARALGYVRVVATGAAFGASSELDAFWVAFRLPDLVLNLVATGALAASLVPALSGLLAVGNTERAWRTASSLLTAAGLFANDAWASLRAQARNAARRESSRAASISSP
jgi:putative peptidoglycan lipid II flippase